MKFDNRTWLLSLSWLLANSTFTICLKSPHENPLGVEQALKAVGKKSAPQNKDIPNFSGPKPAVVEGPPLRKTKELYMEMPLDHRKPEGDKLWLRYWTFEEHYIPGGPVFVFDGGEFDISASVEVWLADDSSFFRSMLRDFGGMGVALENRFYGNSTPGTITLYPDSDLEVYRHHTLEQSLADAPYFAHHFSHPNPSFSDVTMTPDSTPWIWVGGSYPGTRAHMLRKIYPDTVFAAWAAAGPIEASNYNGYYFDQIARGMARYGYGNCTKNIASAIKYIDGELGAGGQREIDVKEMFLGFNGSRNANGDFASTLLPMYWEFQSRGMEAGVELASFCDYLSNDLDYEIVYPNTERSVSPGQESGAKRYAPAEGWEKAKGAKWLAERWAKDPFYVQRVKGWYNCGGYGYTSKNHTQFSYELCDLERQFTTDTSDKPWKFQVCNEFGWFHTSNEGPDRLVSKSVTADYYITRCHKQYAKGLDSGILAKEPQVDKINAKYGGWDLGSHQSRTFYTGGELDPWNSLTLTSTEPDAPKRNLTSRIPGCNEKTPNDSIFGYLLKNELHVKEFWAQNPEARVLFSYALREWLACFRPRSKADVTKEILAPFDDVQIKKVRSTPILEGKGQPKRRLRRRDWLNSLIDGLKADKRKWLELF